jgi:hypothetical protein
VSVHELAVVGEAEVGQFPAGVPPSRVTKYVTVPVPGAVIELQVSATVPAPPVAFVMLGAASVPTVACALPDPPVVQ